MLRPVPMRWLSVVVLERDARAVLRAMGELGVMQLAGTPAGPATALLKLRDRSQELARCDRVLARVAALRQALNIPDPVPTGTSASGTPVAQAEEELLSIEQRAEALLQRRATLESQSSQATAAGERLERFRDVDLPLDQLDRFAFLHCVLGTLPAQHFERLRKSVDGNALLLPLDTDKDRWPLVALSTRRYRPDLERALRGLDFREEVLPRSRTTVSGLVEDSRRQAARAQAESGELDEEIRTFVTGGEQSLADIATAARTERLLLEAEQNLLRTEAAVLLTGWASATEAPAVVARLREITGGRCVARAAPPDDQPEEQIPVLFQHARLLRPFAALVKGYGLPRYRELTPTFFVAVSYLLMFGMMFGDVGHGAVLLAGGLLWRRAGRGAGARDLGALVAFAGLASAVFGAIYGSYFGIAAMRHWALWRDPLEGDPLDLMYVAMVVGVVMISLGLALNITNHLLRREFVAAVTDKFGLAGVLFYWGGLLLLTRYSAVRAAGLATAALLAFVALPMLAWMLGHVLLHGPRRRDGHAPAGGGWMTAFGESAVEAFEAVLVYLANTISFVRLAAYAMSHAALLMAAFLVADTVRRGSALGEASGLAIVVAGNLVAIVLEGVIASVQTVRLEYYEFFSKFFSGAGRPFTPFRLAGKGDGS